MKKIALIFFILLIILSIGAGTALFLGNRPEVLYHTNGKIKSITQRKFFEKNGDQSIFTTDGTLSHQYTLVKGIKNGKAKIYSSSFNPIELTYSNNQVVGDILINKNDINKNIEEFKISAKPNDSFEMNIKSKGYTSTIVGQVVCESAVFIERLQQFSMKKTDQNLKNFLGCIAFNSLTFGDDEIQCAFNGKYQFPEFTSNSNFACKGSFLEQEEFKEFKNLKITAVYDTSKEALIIQTADLNNPTTVASSNFKGIEKIIESIIYFSASQNKEQDQGKLLASIIENFVISNTSALIDNQKVTSIDGDFNIVKGFSDPYVISYYTNNLPTSQIKIDGKGISLKSKYPSNNKPMLAFALNVDETIKNKYNEVMTSLMEEIKSSVNVKDEAMEKIMSKWMDYAWTFSDVLKSANTVIWNNKGEKIIAATATVKQNIRIETFFEDMAKYIDFKVVIYKDNKPVNICKGNLYNGFTINGKEASLDEITQLVKKSDLEKTVKEIGGELETLYSGVENDILQGKYQAVDPFLFGLYSGYSSGMEKYTQNKTSEQFSVLIDNIKIAFTTYGHYNSLNNETAIMSGIIPEDMIDISNGKNNILNASGGFVTLLGSKATSIEDDQADKRAFVIEFGGLSKELCIELSTSYMLNDEKLVGIAAGIQTQQNNNGFGTMGSVVDNIYYDLDTKTSSEGLSYISKSSLPFAFAINACIDENNNNAVAYKYKY